MLLPLLLLPLLFSLDGEEETETAAAEIRGLEVEAATTAPLLLEGLGGEEASESAVARPAPPPPPPLLEVEEEEEETGTEEP